MDLPRRTRDPRRTVVRACGNAFFHALGDPTQESCTKFHRVATVLHPKRVLEVQCGGSFTVVRADDGHVFQWGTLYNLVYPSPTPVLFPGGHTVVQLAAGDKHVLAVTQTGFCFAWGCGLFGRLGLGSHESHRTPQPVPVGNKANIVRVGCGAAHSGAVTADGKVYMWGMNNKAQCGGRPTEFVMAPLRLDMGAADDMRPVDVVGGKHHSLLLTECGQVFSWGAAAGGRLGYRCHLGEVRRPKRINAFRRSVVTQIACGDFHNLALTEDGIAFAWGIGSDAQCGNPKMVNNLSPMAIEALLPDNLGEGVAFVGCGASHSFAVTVSGKLYTWGNHDGGLGHGRQVPRLGYSLDKYTQGRIEDSKLLTPKSVLLPSLVHFSGYHREQVTLASAGKAHTVIVSVENAPQRSRGSGWAPPVAPPPTKPSAGSGKSADSVFQFDSSDSEPEEDQMELIQASVRDAFTLAEAIGQGVLFVKAGGGFTRAVDGVAFASAAEALAAITGRKVAPQSSPPEPEEAPAAVPTPPAGKPQRANSGSKEEESTASWHSTASAPMHDVRRISAVTPTPVGPRDPLADEGGTGMGMGEEEDEGKGSEPTAGQSRSGALAGSVAEAEAKADASSPSEDMFDSPKYSYMRKDTTRTLRQVLSRRQTEILEADLAIAKEEAAQADRDDAALFIQACRHGHVDVINELVNSGFPTEVVDDWGNTPLIVACQSNQVPAAVALLRAGALVNAQNHKGQTCLHYCHKYQFRDLVTLLEQFGADDTIQNAVGLTCYEGLILADLEAFD